MGQFVPTVPYTLPHPWTRAALLEDGQVLIVAGFFGQLFDPRTNTLHELPRPQMYHSLHAMHRLDDGRVLIVGCLGNEGCAELYNPVTQTFDALPAMVTPRTGAALACLPDGRVLVVGGLKPGPDAVRAQQAEIFDPQTNRFTAAASMTQPRLYPAVTVAADGKVIVIGGIVGSTVSHGVEVYSPTTGQFTARAGRMRFSRMNATATTLPDGRILVAGGIGDSPYFAGSVVHAATEIYSPALDRFEPMQFMATTRMHHTATVLPNGTVLVAGGKTDMSGVATWSEIYDPMVGRWDHVTGQMTFGRYLHDAVSLGDGRAFFAGGQDDSGRAPWGEVYLPDRITTRNFER